MKKLWVIGAGVAVVAIGAGGAVYLTRDQGPVQTIATVTGVTAGNALTVELDGSSRSLQLADIEVPAEANGDCLAFEATQQLAAFAPVGAKIRLEVGGVALDTSTAGDALEAVAYLEDGRMINELMAREGLAFLPADASTGAYRYDVQRAQELARTEQLGLYSTGVDCTIPAQVLVISEQVEVAPLSVNPGSPENDLTAQGAEITSILTQATALVTVVNGDQTGPVWDALRSSDRISYAAEAQRALARLEVASGQISAALKGELTVEAASATADF